MVQVKRDRSVWIILFKLNLVHVLTLYVKSINKKLRTYEEIKWKYNSTKKKKNYLKYSTTYVYPGNHELRLVFWSLRRAAWFGFDSLHWSLHGNSPYKAMITQLIST